MGISPKIKFLGQICSVLCFVLLSGISLEHFGNLFGFGDVAFGVFSRPITVLAVAGVINAFNMSDGLDGLAAGICAVACLFLMPLAYTSEHWYVLGILTVLLGVILGFLRYNSHPARLFMGDTGSLLVGYTLGVLAVSLTQPGLHGVALPPITVFIILSIPIMDTLYVMIRRLVKGQQPFHPDATHLHHRLMDMGLGHSLTVTIIYAFCIFMGILAWALKDISEWKQFALLLLVYLIIYTLLAWTEYSEKTSKTQGQLTPTENNALNQSCEFEHVSLQSEALPQSKAVKEKMAALAGKSAKIAPFLLWASLFFPLFLLPPIPRPLGLLALGTTLFIFILYPWRSGTRMMPLAHALVFWSIFIILVLYECVVQQPVWIPLYLAVLSGLTLLWVILRISFKPLQEVILPTSFELLLIAVSWLIPLYWVQCLDLDVHMQMRLIRACVLAIPILASAKAMMRRHARRNVRFVLGLQSILILFGLKAFFV